MSTLIEKLNNTTILNQSTNELVGRIVLKEFLKTQDEKLAFELLSIAHKLKLDVFYPMIDTYQLHDFKWLFN